MEHVEGSETEPHRGHDAEARGDAGNQPVGLVGRQRTERPQTGQPAGGGRDQHEHEQPEIDHRVLRMPR